MKRLAVEVRDLQGSYGERLALDGLDFEVGSGECFAVLGPNGSGKSTLFSILSTLKQPDSGVVKVLGFDLLESPDAVRRSLGVVFQFPSLDKKLTVFENLWHQGHLHGLRGRGLRERVSSLLSRFGLGERHGERLETLSGGLARRVEIAKAMLHEPKILLLDEPSTGLDPRSRRDLADLLFGLGRESGTTVLLTTHLLEEADACSSVLILDEGKRVAMGTPDELKSQIGGGVITLESIELESLRKDLSQELRLEGKMVGTGLRFEVEDPHEVARRLGEGFGERLDLITIGKPSLEDVFLDRTGRSFNGSSAQPGGEG
ncbi:MAG: ATP-binding cassette domain-containing protein [Planctomycetota bacterium]|nr:ATP-binding cassette domain-containing protein [Planctomycetota bacterium]